MSGSAPAAFALAGRTALVTGAAGAIGAATARGLAEAGAAVLACDLEEDALAGLAEGLSAQAGRIRTATVDVTDADAVDALVARALRELGGLDVAVHVAGVIHDAPVVDTTPEDLERVLAVNLKGVFHGCRAAGRAMAERGGGSIVNVASSGAFMPIPELGAYGASKAGVVQLTRTLAAELGPRGVRANCVAPGFVRSRMTTRHARGADGRVDPERAEAVVERQRRRSPLRRVGEPEDVAWACLYLASDAARYVTGQVLHVNGGFPMV
ncbi:MAG: SDR family NAD(P)-dependent oxidoreductase [Myxococcota bacterium]|nr:SDR family NAD(P)-dependent oxidoreductase [Myxococcota bacterium]